ncbi:uncharacterized protein PFL1_05782 [Pseudozyma flocculosa PF-1]|uniref:Uncharacterized protein n=2 Tax=Pseudozyma flocculosa TaxID=84751 RepID=A0A5C3FB02_9BASI|nr:uncharacterized protein PFL1_05782 [Pseudozyma flocculosa PF-1]EPQ26804.1 hypothetical protein PFL1_05782 [Pseudozyma flocculosa PF-1]SPO40865.1 uncharacterized protein PSFLO_06347 [Pseudozyma flocculosa]
MKLCTGPVLLLTVLFAVQHAAVADDCLDSPPPGRDWWTFRAGRLGSFEVWSLGNGRYQFEFEPNDGQPADSTWTLEQKLGPNDMETIIRPTHATSCANVDSEAYSDATNALNAFVLAQYDRLQNYYISYNGQLGQLGLYNY